MTVAIEPDELPGDDRSTAAVLVERGLPVLLIDGDPQADPVRSETYFLQAAFTLADQQAPWVAAETKSWRDWKPADLKGRAAVFLCNVPHLDDEQRAALVRYVQDGGGLVIAPGDLAEPTAYAALAADQLLPYPLTEPKREQNYTLRPILVDSQSLEAGWLSRFRTDTGVDLTQTRFATWWGLTAPRREQPHPTNDASAVAGPHRSAARDAGSAGRERDAGPRRHHATRRAAGRRLDDAADTQRLRSVCP
ncbi:MAG: hypothetical protein U0992_06690 [Planctomycetaceae bacterium]